jgi:two-component system, OmpR family, copper resistance phosphate regulon response regulator CusR
MRILLIEDEFNVAQTLERGLKQQAHAVDVSTSGEEGLEKLRANIYDLLLLDLRLPGKDGWSVCKEVRAEGIAIPILMLTAHADYQDRVRGLDLGADDYLTKPFDFEELCARVRALGRRGTLLHNPVIRVDTLEVDTRSRTVKRSNRTITLTAKEYALLECLARDAEALLSREVISERVWNESYDPFSNLIEEYIKRLRRKVDVPGEHTLIHSRRGEGYILSAQCVL